MDDASRLNSVNLKIAASKGRRTVGARYLMSKDPHRDVKEVFEVKHAAASNTILPQIDDVPLNPNILSRMENHRLKNTEKRLLAKRSDFFHRKKNLDTQWSILEKKEKGLRDTFKIFNRFLKDNFVKRERAEKKIAEDKELKLKRTFAIKILRHKYEKTSVINKKMREEMGKLSMYQDFLGGVVEESVGEFKDLMEPLYRMELLMINRENIQRRQEEELRLFERSKSRVNRMVETKSLEIIGLNNILEELRQRYEKITQRSRELEYSIVSIKVVISNLVVDIAANKSNIDFIYKHLCVRKEMLERKRVKDYLGKLVVISRTLSEYDALKNFKGRTKRGSSRAGMK